LSCLFCGRWSLPSLASVGALLVFPNRRPTFRGVKTFAGLALTFCAECPVLRGCVAESRSFVVRVVGGLLPSWVCGAASSRTACFDIKPLYYCLHLLLLPASFGLPISCPLRPPRTDVFEWRRVRGYVCAFAFTLTLSGASPVWSRRWTACCLVACEASISSRRAAASASLVSADCVALDPRQSAGTLGRPLRRRPPSTLIRFFSTSSSGDAGSSSSVFPPRWIRRWHGGCRGVLSVFLVPSTIGEPVFGALSCPRSVFRRIYYPAL